MIERVMWLVACLSLAGVVLNLYRRREGFLFWMVTNAAWVAYDIHKSARPQAALMAVYFILAVIGWIKWGREDKAPRNGAHAPRSE